ncbi:MAG: DUF5011 domain-containing protein, partial [bacterium]|nr:DUF5011 domain-containing protein [bacterium]
DYFLVQTEGQLATSTPMVGGSQTSNASSGSLTSDTTPPVITLLGDNPVRLSVGGTFVEPGVTIVDDVDGTLSTYVTYVNGIEQPDAASVIDTSSETTYIITYSATDQRGNGVTATRSVIVGSDTTSSTTTTTTTSADTIAPVVTLVGEAALQITVGDTFTDLGATASDDVDGDLTANIAVTGSVDTAIAGSYSLTYSATDKAGNIGSASRMVTVVAAPAAGAASSTPAS